MSNTIILRDEIIEKVKEIFTERNNGKEFSFEELSDDLKKFVQVNENYRLIGRRIFDQFNKGKGLSITMLKRALSRSGNDADSGARPNLRDLLCMYAYNLNWENTLKKKFNSTPEEEVIENNKIKANLLIKNKNIELIQDIRRNAAALANDQLFFKTVVGSDYYNKFIWDEMNKHFLKNGSTNSMAFLTDSMNEIEKVIKKLINSYCDKGILAIIYSNNDILFQNKSDDIIFICDKLLSICKNYYPAYIYKSSALLFKKDFSHAMKIINEGLKLDGNHGYLLINKANIFYAQKKYKETIIVCNQILDLLKNKLLNCNYEIFSNEFYKIGYLFEEDFNIDEVKSRWNSLEGNTLLIKISSLELKWICIRDQFISRWKRIPKKELSEMNRIMSLEEKCRKIYKDKYGLDLLHRENPLRFNLK